MAAEKCGSRRPVLLTSHRIEPHKVALLAAPPDAPRLQRKLNHLSRTERLAEMHHNQRWKTTKMQFSPSAAVFQLIGFGHKVIAELWQRSCSLNGPWPGDQTARQGHFHLHRLRGAQLQNGLRDPARERIGNLIAGTPALGSFLWYRPRRGRCQIHSPGGN